MRSIVVIALVVAGCDGCVDRGAGPQAKKIEPSYIRANLLTAVPQDIDKLEVDLGGGKLRYLGNKLVYTDGKPATTPLAPGGAIRLMHYWQVIQPVDAKWRVFTLVRGAPGSIDFMNLSPTDMQIGHPTKKWKPGQIIQDVQDIVLRPDWRSPTAVVQVGLVEAGGNQLGDRMPATGPSVVDRAIVARTIEVDMSRAPPPLGTVYIPRAAGPITIDGVANDVGWTNAVTSPELVTADGSPEPVGKATARMAWDDQNLYVWATLADTDVFSPFKQHDETIWKGDCIEMFIDADGNRTGYVELQVNPNNATFDSYFATTRAQPGDEKWEANMVTAVKVRGTADKSGDADQGWDVEIAIPLAAVKGNHESMAVRLPPQVGDKWRLNVVRVDYRSGGGGPGVASWNRISYSDFHALDRMLNVVFADVSGSIVAKPPGEVAPPAAGSGQGSAQGSAQAPPPPAQTPPPPAQTPPPTKISPPAGSAGSAAMIPVTPSVHPGVGSAAPAPPPRRPAAGSNAPASNPKTP